MDEWLYENDWGHKQQENQRRLDRDGEVIIRFVKNKKLLLRYVEPYELYQPKTKADYSNLFGVQVDPEDVETVEGYWINDKLVKPTEIQHRKANVDSKVRRGIPLLHPVKENLRRVDKIYRNMAIVYHECIWAFSIFSLFLLVSFRVLFHERNQVGDKNPDLSSC